MTQPEMPDSAPASGTILQLLKLHALDPLRKSVLIAASLLTTISISNYAATLQSLMDELLETMQEESDDPAEQNDLIEAISADLKQNMERIVSNCARAQPDHPRT